MRVKTVIRDALPSDYDNWLQLWVGYNAFYKNTLSPDVTHQTWQRILDPQSLTFCRIAEYEEQVAGFSINVLHDSTWATTPVCYLEDLFVNPAYRGKGAGRALINDLIALAGKNGWSRLYWHTQNHNPARKLYDKYAAADGFVRYSLPI